MGNDWNSQSPYGNPPCRECNRRSAGCHGDCEEYGEWKKRSEKIRHEINLAASAENYRQGQIVKYKNMKWQENRRRK